MKISPIQKNNPQDDQQYNNNQQEEQDYHESQVDGQQQQDELCDMEHSQGQQQNDDDEQIQPPRRKRVKRNQQQIQGELVNDSDNDDSSNFENIFDDDNVMDKLPTDKTKLQDLLIEVSSRTRHYRSLFFTEQQNLPTKKSHLGENSIPICGDITKLDFEKLITKQLQIANRQFDVLMMDPPWRLSSSQPSRGVAIQYQSLSDQLIQKIPVETLQKQGFLFVWVINAKFQWTVNTMEKKWGYKVVDSINWVKKTVNGKIAKGHGFYLQHAKETCLVGYKGDFSKFKGNVACDIIFSDRRGQSQKPTQIYEYIEELVPNGYYLQIFGRRNNLRDRWVTIGNEL